MMRVEGSDPVFGFRFSDAVWDGKLGAWHALFANRKPGQTPSLLLLPHRREVGTNIKFMVK